MLDFPFDDERLDQLFALKKTPQPLDKIKSLFNGQHDSPLLTSLLTQDAPRPYEKYTGDGVRWRYFGHACILVETKDVTMLFDPVLSYDYPAEIRRYTYDDLPPHIDYVLITHDHQDHVLFETLIQIRSRVGLFVVPRNRHGSLQDPSLKMILENVGCTNVHEISDLEELRIPDGSITALPFFGEHADLDIQTKAAYLIK
jgi:L-ascorbate metabolism protein UlaG (beta-lactamase superfamily)